MKRTWKFFFSHPFNFVTVFSWWDETHCEKWDRVHFLNLRLETKEHENSCFSFHHGSISDFIRMSIVWKRTGDGRFECVNAKFLVAFFSMQLFFIIFELSSQRCIEKKDARSVACALSRLPTPVLSETIDIAEKLPRWNGCRSSVDQFHFCDLPHKRTIKSCHFAIASTKHFNPLERVSPYVSLRSSAVDVNHDDRLSLGLAKSNCQYYSTPTRTGTRRSSRNWTRKRLYISKERWRVKNRCAFWLRATSFCGCSVRCRKISRPSPRCLNLFLRSPKNNLEWFFWF